MSILTEILFPRRCLLCEQLLLSQEEGPVCEECRPEEYLITGARCRCCSRPVEEAGGVCASCLFHGHTTPGFSLFAYEGSVRDSIHRFKYEDQRMYARGYAELFLHYAKDAFNPAGVAAFVPIPIHRSRLKTRGYNQAAELSKALSRAYGIPSLELLIRVRKTRVQNRLSSRGRRDNVHGAFAFSTEEAKKLQREGRLVIVDDIYTSGSTVEAAAGVLRTALPEREVRFLTLSMKMLKER